MKHLCKPVNNRNRLFFRYGLYGRYQRLKSSVCKAIWGLAIIVIYYITIGMVPWAEANPVIINEFLADPPLSEAGDANGDGYRDASEDEFVELVNISTQPVDLDGWTLRDSYGERYTFPDDTTLDPGFAAVVFGGGYPSELLWNYTIIGVTDSGLGLSNNGDTITLSDSLGNVVAEYTYGPEAGNEQSVTRNPDYTGTWQLHSEAHPDGNLFSPGYTLLDEEIQSVYDPLRANAGEDQIVFDTVELDGSKTLPGHGIVSYEWQLIYQGDPIHNKSATGVTPIVTDLEPGFYYVILKVTDVDDPQVPSTDGMTLGAIGQKGDLDLDGDVDGKDLSEFADAFGPTY
jgi:Lamin Tail Domain/K319L-like, PKD domain